MVNHNYYAIWKKQQRTLHAHITIHVDWCESDKTSSNEKIYASVYKTNQKMVNHIMQFGK